MDALKNNKPAKPELKRQELKDLEFQVMPKFEQTESGLGHELETRTTRKKTTAIVTGSILTLLLVGAGVWAYFQFREKAPAIRDSDIILEVPEIDQKKDSDQDGLPDSKEQEFGTGKSKPDSDADGLSDGDEVSVYGSDPLLFDSDHDGFNDGAEVVRAYSPVQNSPEQSTADELKKWAQGISKFGLHEPTITTLSKKPTAANPEPIVKAVYTNKIYKYQVELPSLIVYREADGGKNAGLYIIGTIPDEESVATDPISIMFAGKLENQSLKEWVESSFPRDDYEKIQETGISGQTAVVLKNFRDSSCPQDKTFFVHENNVTVLTWTCNEFTAMGNIYQEVLNSFKFQE